MFRKEAHVKAAIKDILGENGIWYTMPYQAGFSQPGVPDFICCHQGMFLAIEAKFGRNKPTPAQAHQMDLIREADGTALVVYEKDIEHLRKWLGGLNDRRKVRKW